MLLKTHRIMIDSTEKGKGWIYTSTVKFNLRENSA